MRTSTSDSIFFLARYNYSPAFDSYFVLREIEKDIEHYGDDAIFLVNVSGNRVLSICEVASRYHMIDDASKWSYSSLIFLGQKFIRTFERSEGHFIVEGQQPPKPVEKAFTINRKTALVTEL